MAIWMLWVPAQIINFAFSPMWMRVPFVACVSVLWTSILSIRRGATHHGEFAATTELPPPA